MKKDNLFIFAIMLFVSAITFSCKKTATNILVGNWKLTSQHTVTITPNDTTSYDTTYNLYTSQILEFNGNNTYAYTDYTVSPITVMYGKYTFSGGSAGSIVLTPDPTAAAPVPTPINTAYVIIPATSFSNSVLYFPSTTTSGNATIHDTTFYTYH